MSNNERCLEINKSMTDCTSKMRALYNLINVTLIDAEQDRTELGLDYEKMIDYKNDVNTILTDVSAVKKAERPQIISKNRGKLRTIQNDAKRVNESFVSVLAKYKKVLKESLPLKVEYLKEVKELCNEFNAILQNGQVEEYHKKGFSQQLKMVKLINSKTEELICDYNVKRNQLESDNEKFNALYTSVNNAISQLQVTA